MGGMLGICPSVVKRMAPPHIQVHILLFVSAGWPCTIHCGLPGIHGATIAGTQGMGVSTPCAAAVADATVGFDKVLHMPKGSMFTMGV